MLLHVNRHENRKKGNSAKIPMSLYHIVVMLLHTGRYNDLGRCKYNDLGRAANECGEKLGGQRSGSCGMECEGSEVGAVHLQSTETAKGRSFH